MKKISDYKSLVSKLIECRNALEIQYKIVTKGKTLKQQNKDVGCAFTLGQYSIVKNILDICKTSIK